VSGQGDLERRIAQLEDREAIRDLVYRYTELVRFERMEDEGSLLFTPDVIWELHHADPLRPGESTLQRRVEGPEAIAGSFEENAGAGAQVWAMIHNLRIELEGDQARSTCVLATAIWPHGRQMVGEYRDRFRRTENGWLFAARTYVLFGDVAGNYAAATHQDYIATAGTSPR
jgi:hypothetical protein